MAENKEWGWDDEIEASEEKEYVVLKPGEYDFEITDLERIKYDGSDKLPPCWQARLHLAVKTPEGTATIMHNLFLVKKCGWQVDSLAMAIGRKHKDDKTYKMGWDSLVGCTGRAKIKNRTHNDKTYNEVDRFIPKMSESKGWDGAF